MYATEFETKEKQKLPEMKNKKNITSIIPF